jgi:hypothetical protein
MTRKEDDIFYKNLQIESFFVCFLNNLGLELEGGVFGKEISVDFMSSSHGESPNVLDLSTHVKVDLCDQDTVIDS